MTTVLYMFKELNEQPYSQQLKNMTLRNFDGEADIESWLKTRTSAFTQLAGRPWTERDFHRELTIKSWWRAEQAWLIFDQEQCVATVALEVAYSTTGGSDSRVSENQGCNDANWGQIHWLAVHRDFTRRGLGSWLLATCENFCWEKGVRVMKIETLSTWHPAVAFYESHGYRSRAEM